MHLSQQQIIDTLRQTTTGFSEHLPTPPALVLRKCSYSAAAAATTYILMRVRSCTDFLVEDSRRHGWSAQTGVVGRHI